MSADTATGADEHDGVDSGDTHRIGLRFRAGDESALEAAYAAWSPLVHTISVRATSDRAEADDVTQQVFVKAWHSRDSFDPERRPLPAWLVGILRHVLADRAAGLARDQRLRRRLVLEQREEPDRAASAVVDTVVVSEGLLRVPQPRRRILELAYFADLTQVEIADHLDLPLGTVKSHLRRGLVQLRDAVEATDATP